MTKNKKLSRWRVWLRQIRASFLMLAVVLVLIGWAAAWRAGFWNWPQALLILVGIVLAHISVNLFNELSDYRSRIDEHTVPTPFSGGSGMLQAGETSPRAVTVAAYLSMAAAGLIGVYFFWRRGWLVLLLMMGGGIAIRFYTSHLSRWLIGELAAGITLGSFVVLGTYLVLRGELNCGIILVSIPPGILTSLLLLLNEFPDLEADRGGGRRHLLIWLGRRKCAWLYVAGLGLVYLGILSALFWGGAPPSLLMALLTMPLAAVVGQKVLRFYDNRQQLVPAQGLNVALVLLTDFLLATGFLFR